jgi:integrase
MASVYKKTEDKGKPNSKWFMRFKDRAGNWRTRQGFKTKSASLKEAIRLEDHERKIRDGVVDELAEDLKANMSQAVTKHVDAFEKFLEDEKLTPKHVSQESNRVRRIVKAGRFTSLEEMTKPAVYLAIQNLRDGKVIGEKSFKNRTFQHYLSAIKNFGNYLADDVELIPQNPWRWKRKRKGKATKANPEKDRRAMTHPEFECMLRTARESKIEVQCHCGETRARIYTVAAYTGFRHAEIAGLTWGHVNQRNGTILVQADLSKNGEKVALPLNPQLHLLLKTWFKRHKKNELLFPKLGGRKAYKMIEKDLNLAGISQVTPDGELDFHALRSTFITWLDENGVPIAEIQKLARHADIRTTAAYLKSSRLKRAAAIAKLPSLATSGSK